MITLAVAQTQSTADPALNLDTLAHICQKAACLGCRAVCFPEAFLTGYLPEQANGIAIECDSALTDEVKAIASRFDIDILVGFFERFQQKLYITHGVFRSDGKTAFYRKTHLGEKESHIFASGESLDIFELSCGIKIAFQLCVETHFAAVTEALSLKGAQVVFAPHAVPSSSGNRKHIWEKYIPARSYDNRVYFACCNHSGKRFGGGCFVTAPNGDVISSKFDDAEGIVTFEVDTELLEKYHTDNSSHRFRYYPKLLKKELCR